MSDSIETTRNAWRADSRTGLEQLGKALANRDTMLIRAVAMATVDWQLCGGANSNDYYDTRLREAGLTIAGDKPAMRAATLATGLDRGDKAFGAIHGKTLDAIAVAMEGLLLLVGSGVKMEYSPACAADLIKRINEFGGLRKLGDLARNEAIDDNPRGVIRMNGKAVRETAENRLRERLGPLSRSPLVIAGVDKDGALAAVGGFHLDFEQVAAALTEHDIREERPQALFEVTRAVMAISAEKTEFVKVHDADPKDKKTAKRDTEPHIVFCPDHSVVVAAHLTPGASNVVVMRGVDQVFDAWPTHHVMLPPQVHRKLALNLAKASQRNAVEITEEQPDPQTKLADRTWHLRSEAALHPRYQLSGPGLLSGNYDERFSVN